MPEEQDLAEFDFDFGERPKKKRPKPKFDTPEHSRRRMMAGWYWRIQDTRIKISHAIKALRRDYPKTYTERDAERDAEVFLLPLKEHEKRVADQCKAAIEGIPIAEWLVTTVKGMGYILAAQLIGVIGKISLFPTVSKLWKYGGLAPDQRRVKGEKSTHNPALKRLMFNIATSFAKSGGFYAEAYGFYKAHEEAKFNDFMRRLRAALIEESSKAGEKVLARIKEEEKAAAMAKAKSDIFSFKKFVKAVYDGACVLGFDPPPALLAAARKDPEKGYALIRSGIRYLAERFNPPVPTVAGQPIAVRGVPALTPAQRHMRSFRKVEKLFLQHIWLEWRRKEGLPIQRPWVFEIGLHSEANYVGPPDGKDAQFPAVGGADVDLEDFKTPEEEVA